MQLVFSPEAVEIVDRLAGDPAKDRLVDSIWDALELIEEVPDSALARRRALRTPRGHSV